MNEVKLKNKSINNFLYDKNKRNSNQRFSNDYIGDLKKSTTSKRSSLGDLFIWFNFIRIFISYENFKIIT